MCPWEPLGGVRQHLHTVSGFRDNSILGGKEKDILRPSPDVPQTSFLPAGVLGQCWYGVAVPGEIGGISPEPQLEAI